MNAEAKKLLATTIRGLRVRLLADLRDAAESRYRLGVRAQESGLAEDARVRRERFEAWLHEQVRGTLERQTEVVRGNGEIATDRSDRVFERAVDAAARERPPSDPSVGLLDAVAPSAVAPAGRGGLSVGGRPVRSPPPRSVGSPGRARTRGTTG